MNKTEEWRRLRQKTSGQNLHEFFKNLYLKHIDALLRALSLQGIGVAACSWRFAGKQRAATKKRRALK